MSQAIVGSRQVSQVGAGAQQVSYIQQKFHRRVQVQSRCRSCWQLFYGVTDTGLVSQTATGTEQMSDRRRCRTEPQAIAGTEQASQSKRGMERLSQAVAVIGQVSQAGTGSGHVSQAGIGTQQVSQARAGAGQSVIIDWCRQSRCHKLIQAQDRCPRLA